MNASYLFPRGLLFGRPKQPPIESAFAQHSPAHLMGVVESIEPPHGGNIYVHEQGFQLRLTFGQQHTFAFFPHDEDTVLSVETPIDLETVRQLLDLIERGEWPEPFLNAVAEKAPWDAVREAEKAFLFLPTIEGVVLRSDVHVIRKAERGPSGHREKQVFAAVLQAAKEGTSQDVADVIRDARWPAEPCLWWAWQVAQLAEPLIMLDRISREHKIQCGVSLANLSDTVGMYHMWRD